MKQHASRMTSLLCTRDKGKHASLGRVGVGEYHMKVSPTHSKILQFPIFVSYIPVDNVPKIIINNRALAPGEVQQSRLFL